jgi:hypothetical protein
VSARPLITSERLAERMGLSAIDAPDGTRLEVQSLEIETKNKNHVKVRVCYAMFGPKPAPEAESTGGYFVPVELEEAVRTGIDIVKQCRAVPLEPDVSDWIDGKVKPTIVGVYERQYGPTSVSYCMWDGAHWLFPTDSVATAADAVHINSTGTTSFKQELPWRGLRHYPARETGK